MGDEEVEDTSLKATVAATLAAVGLSSDADPHHRLGSTRAVAQSQLESMLDALRPLPVARTGEGEAEDEAPETVGDLVVRGRLGEGGMGIVELAYQRTLDREVALKRLRVTPAPGSAPQLFGLLDEARVSGRLEHPNIVPVHAIGRDEKLGPIVLFKRVQGETWAEALKKDAARLPHDAPTLERHLRVLLQVGHALRFAHSRGVLHRDVKPENVMLGAFGEVYLLDWGLAFPLDGSRPGVAAVAGTATHMAPEMARGDLAALSPATDVFLLGATLHEVLTGEPRHRGEGLAATLLAAMVAEPAAYEPAVPPELGAIANRACAADPAHRFQDVEAFQQAIEDYLDQREARLLVESARELVAPIDAEDAIGRSTEHAVRDQAETLRRFQEARFALDQALRLRPSFALAQRERRRTLLLMLRWALAREDVGQALAAVEELDEPPPPDLRALLEALRSAQRDKRARMKALERDVDLSVAQPERLRAMLAALLGLTAAHVIGWLRHPGAGLDLPPVAVLQEGALVAGAILAALFVARRRLMTTKLNRQFLRGAAAVALGMLANRTIGVLAGSSAPVIFTAELVLIAGLFIAVQTPVRPLPFVGLAGLATALLGGWKPSLARALYMGFTELTVLGLAVGLVLEGRQTAPEGGAEADAGDDADADADADDPRARDQSA